MRDADVRVNFDLTTVLNTLAYQEQVWLSEPDALSTQPTGFAWNYALIMCTDIRLYFLDGALVGAA